MKKCRNYQSNDREKAMKYNLLFQKHFIRLQCVIHWNEQIHKQDLESTRSLFACICDHVCMHFCLWLCIQVCICVYLYTNINLERDHGYMGYIYFLKCEEHFRAILREIKFSSILLHLQTCTNYLEICRSLKSISIIEYYDRQISKIYC